MEAPWPLQGLESARVGGPRRTRVDLAAPEELAAGWEEEAEWIYRQALPDGRPALTLERHQQLGFRMFAHRYGHWLIAADGSSIRTSHAEDLEPWLWQRFLVAQVLPFAALLEGLEVFHASGVVLDDRVVAIVAGSGGGKTSLGLNLVLLGMPFFTDDVLALEQRDGTLVCMPGAGSANVRDETLRRLCEHGRSTDWARSWAGAPRACAWRSRATSASLRSARSTSSIAPRAIASFGSSRPPTPTSSSRAPSTS